MPALRWIAALIVAIVLTTIVNLIQQFLLVLFFDHLNYWVASVFAVVLVLLVSNQISQYCFFIIPYVKLKVTSVSFYYLVLFLLLGSFLMQANRNDFHLDNSIPKWVHVLVSFILFIITYGLKNYVAHTAELNRRVFYKDYSLPEINEEDK